MARDQTIPIWFFIGGLLTIYGALVLGAGIYDVIRPAASPVVLSGLHLAIWWGIGMLALGLTYLIRYRPRR